MRKKSVGKIVDLFSGCGGFSLGAELAGFKSLAAIDIDPTLQSGYRRNFPGTRAVQANIADIDRGAWRQLLDGARPDGVIGGPPCQGFSTIGKRRKDDPRNSLVHHYFRHIALLRPKFFVMENVAGLLNEDNIDTLRDAIDSISGQYEVLAPFVVNASHFGAPTSRRRVIVVGFDPSEVDPLSARDLVPRAPKQLMTVREAISDLPGPLAISKHEHDADFGWARYPAAAYSGLSPYAKRMRRRPSAGLGWRKAIDFFENGFVSGLLTTAHSKEVAKRYRKTRGGEIDHKTKSYRLEWDGLCPTLRAGTGSDKGSFQAVRPLHPGKGRVITVREAARLQGFPDWFVFHPTKWHSFRMIGNSVSPLVSYGLMRKIAAYCT